MIMLNIGDVLNKTTLHAVVYNVHALKGTNDQAEAIVLCYSTVRNEWITAHVDNDSLVREDEWYWGHYFGDRKKAQEDYAKRIKLEA